MSAYLNAHPGSFNHVEPLNYLKVSRINENQDSRADKAIDVIKNFINCKYDYAKSKLFRQDQINYLRNNGGVLMLFQKNVKRMLNFNFT